MSVCANIPSPGGGAPISRAGGLYRARGTGQGEFRGAGVGRWGSPDRCCEIPTRRATHAVRRDLEDDAGRGPAGWPRLLGRPAGNVTVIDAALRPELQ